MYSILNRWANTRSGAITKSDHWKTTISLGAKYYQNHKSQPPFHLPFCIRHRHSALCMRLLYNAWMVLHKVPPPKSYGIVLLAQNQQKLVAKMHTRNVWKLRNHRRRMSWASPLFSFDSPQDIAFWQYAEAANLGLVFWNCTTGLLYIVLDWSLFGQKFLTPPVWWCLNHANYLRLIGLSCVVLELVLSFWWPRKWGSTGTETG